MRGQAGQITKLETTTKKERAPLLYDLTSLQREANNRYGFSARRTLSAAQRLYEEHKALTYPRTNSRFLSTDMIDEIKPTAEGVGKNPVYAKPAAYVTGLDVLPLGRVINDAKVTDHHAIIPTRSEHRVGEDERRRQEDLRHGRAALPRRLPSRRGVGEHAPRDHRRRAHLPHPRPRAARAGLALGLRRGRGRDGEARETDDDEVDQTLPKLAADEPVDTREVASAEKETKPPRRYSDASLLGAMETAGKDVDDEALREAMKDSGIGTPATRASIIERLIDVGYIERDARSLVCTEKGLNVIRLLDGHALTSPGLTGDWEHRLSKIEHGDETRERFMADIAEFARSTVAELDAKLKEVRIPRANLGPCPVCGHDIVENRKGFSCWSREDPGCGFVIWKSKAGKQLPAAVARELISTGKTEKAVTGFKGRSGRSFRARLALEQTPEGKWRVEFDEPWAREGAKPPEAEGEPAAGDAETPATDAAASAEAA